MQKLLFKGRKYLCCMIRLLSLLVLCCIINFTAFAQTIDDFNYQLKKSTQTLSVKTPSGNSMEGNMFLYERKKDRKHWMRIASFPVTFARSVRATDINANI